MENKAIITFNNQDTVTFDVAWPRWEPGTSGMSLLSREQQRIWCFWQATKQSCSSNKSSLTSKSNHFKSSFSNNTSFSSPSSYEEGKRSSRTGEIRDMPILTLRHCPCKPNSRIPGRLGSSYRVVFTGISGLHQQRFLPLIRYFWARLSSS